MKQLCIVMGTLCAAAVSWSTTFVPMTLEERVAVADAVVEVTVESVSSSWEGGRLVTFYSATAHRWFSGEAGPEVLFALPGGVHGALGQKVAGSPGLEVGARYVLLLGPPTGPAGARGVVMLGEGVFGASPGASDEPVRADAFKALTR